MIPEVLFGDRKRPNNQVADPQPRYGSFQVRYKRALKDFFLVGSLSIYLRLIVLVVRAEVRASSCRLWANQHNASAHEMVVNTVGKRSSKLQGLIDTC